jgi:hypothetical protein
MRGICTWCKHHHKQHQGAYTSKKDRYPHIRWLRSACSVEDCLCRKYEG